MDFNFIQERKDQLFFPAIWYDAKTNPEHFYDAHGKVVSFKNLEQVITFLKKERPLLCRLGIKKFPKVGYVKAVSKTDYHILK